MSKLFGGGQKAASGGIQGDVLATDNNTVVMGDAGIKYAIQGSNVPNPDEAVPSFVSGAMAKAGKGLLFFFQAEDGIRVRNVTGVQTCALPISPLVSLVSLGAIVAACIPSGASTPEIAEGGATKGGAHATPSATLKPASNVMTTPFTDDFEQIGRASCRESVQTPVAGQT